MREKINQLLHSEAADLREQLLRLILVVGLTVTVTAILAGFFLQNSLTNTLGLSVLLAIIVIAMVAVFRYRKVEFAAICFALFVICGIFPVMFLVSGGLNGGAAIWLVLGMMYIFMMFRGRRLLFFLLLATAADVAAYITAYLHPEIVVSVGGEIDAYFDSLFAVLTVGIAEGVAMWYQIRLYEKERDLTFKQKEEIQEISKSKDMFFTNISHELRSPINTIIGLNEMILREDISDEVAENAFHVKNASKMLLTLINDILDFSQIESDRMTILPAPYHTRDLFEDVVDMLQVRMNEKKLDFFVDIDDNLPSVLRGDEVRIKQILINLLTNAAKYTQKGSVTLKVQGEPGEDGNERLSISVTDTGIGIRKEDLESLYGYFKRVDREKNRKIEGSGLGLAITKQLVSLMGGRLTVDSVYTKGSVFTVILEQSIEDATPVGKIRYLRKTGHGNGRYYQQSFEAPLAKILVVDDNETNLMVIEKLLRATKVQVEKARSGEECLDMMGKKTYHVVLLDRMMPGMDGLETLKAIRRQESGMGRMTPVIVQTADNTSGSQQKCLNLGFDGYLSKPVDGALLEAEIMKFLPEELIEYQSQAEAQNKERVLNGPQRKKKKIQISTDCVSDLSEEYIEKYDLKMMYQYIETERGVFCDTIEINADNLARYLSRPGNKTNAISATVEEYEDFYAETLMEAEELIHISMAGNTGSGYQNAMTAARGFDHVHVIDAGHISCGQGLLVLTACTLLAGGCSHVEELCGELDRVKEQIETSMILPVVGARLSRRMQSFCKRFSLFPLVQMRQGGMHVTGFEFGNFDRAMKWYIRRRLFRKGRIDTRVVFIIHAGCTVRQQKEFVDEVLRCVPFEQVIVERTSVSSASSIGVGAMGMAYLTKTEGKEYINGRE